MNRIYLVRHGENPANLTKEFSSRKVDYPLTAKGRLQAAQTAEYFLDKNIHAVYASPLKRAAETAAIIAARLGLEVAILETFREVQVGRLEDEPPTVAAWALHNQVLADWVAGRRDARFPGGDDYFSLWDRFQAGLRTVLEGREGQNILIAGHGGQFTLTLPDLCPDIRPDIVWQTQSHNCSITELCVKSRNGRISASLVRWASTDHLSGLAAELVSGYPEPDSLPEN